MHYDWKDYTSLSAEGGSALADKILENLGDGG
jgi:hypothetical protein